MAEPIPHVDDAAAYVLGTLGWRERRRFEAHLKKSPELQKVVRLLEAGSIGLAMAAPRREPPIRLWAGIQSAVTRESEKRARSAKRMWLRNVAAIAACAVIGWFAYTNWNDRPSAASPPTAGVNDVAETTAKVANSPAPALARATSQASNLVSQPPRERRGLRPGENATLRERVGTLEDQIAHLSQTVTQQQQSVPPDLNRLTFINIVPEGSDGPASPQVATASPELRRALLLGVARQLGWTPAPPPPSSALPTSPSTPPFTQPADPNPPAPHNDAGVDFVDLPPPPGDTPSPEVQTAAVEKPQSPPALATTTTTTTSNTASSEENAEILEGHSPVLSHFTSRVNRGPIPAFLSGTAMVFAIDAPSIGTETVSFYSGNAGGPALFYGTITLGNNPTVVTMPVLQVRAWDYQGNQGAAGGNSAVLPAPGRISFSTTSEGPTTVIRFILTDSTASSP